MSVCSTRGTYDEPRNFFVGGIEGVVVDPHNEAFGFWYNSLNEDGPGVLLHIDNHADLAGGSKAFKNGKDIKDYSKQDLNIATFIIPAVYHGLIDCIYWFDPRGRNMDVYGRGEFNLEVVESGGVLLWQSKGRTRYSPDGKETLNYTVLKKDLKDFEGFFILDIDLDAFECVNDDEFALRNAGDSFDLLNGRSNERLVKTFNLLRRLPRPDFISVARSQTPYAYTPTERVNGLEKRLLKGLRKVYW